MSEHRPVTLEEWETVKNRIPWFPNGTEGTVFTDRRQINAIIFHVQYMHDDDRDILHAHYRAALEGEIPLEAFVNANEKTAARLEERRHQGIREPKDAIEMEYVTSVVYTEVWEKEIGV